jgi:hypothetical protein
MLKTYVIDKLSLSGIRKEGIKLPGKERKDREKSGG